MTPPSKPAAPIWKGFKYRRSWLRPCGILAVSAFVLLLGRTNADTICWNGTGADWGTNTFWSTVSGAIAPNPVAAPVAGRIANFSINTVTTAQIVNLNADRSVGGAGGLPFLGTNTSTTLLRGGGTDRALTLGTSGITVNSLAGEVTIGSATAGQNVAITMSGAQSWTNDSTNALTIQNAVANGGFLLTATGTGNITINGAIDGTRGPAKNGTGTLTKTDTGALTLTGANTYTGATVISGGVLEVGEGGSLASTSNIMINSGGTLPLSGSTNYNRINDSAAVTLNGGKIVMGGSASLDEQVGALSLSANSAIDFGTLAGGSILRFADSTGATWGAFTLSIWNWTEGADHLYFGSVLRAGLPEGKLGKIFFYTNSGSNPAGGAPADFGPGNGGIAPLPEPATVLVALSLLSLAGLPGTPPALPLPRSSAEEERLKGVFPLRACPLPAFPQGRHGKGSRGIACSRAPWSKMRRPISRLPTAEPTVWAATGITSSGCCQKI